MTETRTVHDPFLGRDVQVSDRLVDRLRGRYANGPTMPNGEPEFGWREFQTPLIQKQAADTIEALVAFAEFIRDGYERTDINHVDFRVGAYKAALDALDAVSAQRMPSDG